MTFLIISQKRENPFSHGRTSRFQYPCNRSVGIFPKADFRLGTFSISIQNFRLDFYDSEKFSKPSSELCTQTIEAVISDQKNNPEMPVYDLKGRNQNYKIPDNVLNKLNNFSFPWFNEYANTIVELNRFNEYELFQQPLCFIYFCSIDDPLNKVKPQMNDREKIPPLFLERVYDSDMPIVIIILNDKSPDTPFLIEHMLSLFALGTFFPFLNAISPSLCF